MAEVTLAYTIKANDNVLNAIKCIMEAIDDEKFTPEALRANPEAMRAVEQGASVGEVYRMYFLGGAKMPVQETEANLGLGGWMGDGLTPEQIERISAYVSKTGQTYEMD